MVGVEYRVSEKIAGAREAIPKSRAELWLRSWFLATGRLAGKGSNQIEDIGFRFRFVERDQENRRIALFVETHTKSPLLQVLKDFITFLSVLECNADGVEKLPVEHSESFDHQTSGEIVCQPVNLLGDGT